MWLKFLSLKGERGDASIFLAMILALTVGTTVYYNMDKMNQTLKSNKITGQKQKAETRNISGLSTAAALMHYSGANPQSDDTDSLPYLYPDPYLPNGSAMGTPRGVMTSTTWSFASMKLEVASPSDSKLTASDFSAYVNGGARPTLDSKSSIKFLKPVMSPTNDYNIIGYEAEITSKSFGNQSLVSKATIPVPPPLQPKCSLRSADGQTKFQPNSTMDLVLMVSGVAVSARIPDTTEALVAERGSFKQHKQIDLVRKANSVRRIDNEVYSWRVTSPRPLVAVDGANDVTFVAYAYITPVDNNSETAIACPFTYKVSPPATCKLWTDKATVPPGQCVNLTSGYMGPVQSNSLQMWAEDLNGKNVSGITQSGDTGRFCTPTVSSYATGTKVPQAAADAFASPVSALSFDQQKALYEVLKDLRADLNKLFTSAPELQNLSINQFNDLWNLGPAQLADLSVVDFSTFTYLSTLTQAQLDVLKTLKASDFTPLDNMKPIDLSTVNLLDKGVKTSVLNDLSSFDSKLLIAYLGHVLDKEAADRAPPSDYKIRASVSAIDGSKNSCMVTVTAGTNQCPFFGSQFPNHTVEQTLTVIYNGQPGSATYTFKPSDPNWEVDGIATSPVDVVPCPADARCYAVDFGNNRTPFAIVHNADRPNCSVTTNMRIDLGCFAADSRIRMADGQDKAIKELQEGDLVWNPLRKKVVAIRRVTPGPELAPLWSIKTDSGLVQVTAKHPFLTASGLKVADELQAGDRIIGEKGESIIQSVSVAKDAPKDWVWNFEIATDSKEPEDHAILADGVVTGDLYLQEQLAGRNMKSLTQAKP